MNGATAVPSVTTTKILTARRANIIGNNQYFFLTKTNEKNSFKNPMLIINMFKCNLSIMFYTKFP